MNSIYMRNNFMEFYTPAELRQIVLIPLYSDPVQCGFPSPAAGCGLNPGINQWRFIPPPWRVTPVNRIEMQLFVAFAQQ